MVVCLGLLLALATGAAGRLPAQDPRTLLVCVDPDNMPFSNREGAGFENELASLLAGRLHARLQRVFWAQRRGYARRTLGEDRCDLWPGVAVGVERMITTRPYYRSGYMFVSRAANPLQGLTLDDPRLKDLRLGVQMVGDDATNTPPAHALARRGITQNVRGYPIYGGDERPDPRARIIEAVARGDIDVAMVWGPVAGYFASRSRTPLRLEAVTPTVDAGLWPMAYDIAIGVRQEEPQLKKRIDDILQTQQPAIDRLLDKYHIPHLPAGSLSALGPHRQTCCGASEPEHVP